MGDTYKIGDYILSQDVIGRGVGGKILRTLHAPSQTEVAVKMISFSDPENRRYFENEARIFHASKHIPQVIPTLTCFTHEAHGFICMKLFSSSLQSLLISKQRLSMRRVVKLFGQIVEGIHQLHQKNIAHLNLNPENLLLSQKDGDIWISDFAKSIFVESDQLGNVLLQLGVRGVKPFTPPEMIPGAFYDPAAADSWSLGAILFAMITGAIPEDNDSLLQELSVLNQATVGEHALDLLHKLLDVEPKRRLTTETILTHPFLTSDVAGLKRFPSIQKIRNILR